MRSVTSDEVRAYHPVIARLATSVSRSGIGRQASAEFDDLFQEGSIFVWQTLQKGLEPSSDLIRKRMLNWVRFLMRHDNLSYDEVIEQGLVPLAVHT